jgi:hypothetical protein
MGLATAVGAALIVRYAASTGHLSLPS